MTRKLAEIGYYLLDLVDLKLLPATVRENNTGISKYG
jgi:hypothetical protein